MDDRLRQAPVVPAFARAVRPVAGVLGLYAGGSLASGDFRPGRSDLDLVAVVAEELDAPRRARLRALHEDLRRGNPAAAGLHCVYVPREDVDDVATRHLTWAHGELYCRELSGIARAEVLRGGITVLGPDPAQLLPPVDDAALRAAARAEFTGYWSGAVRKPWLWLQDGYVDLGLVTLARAEATLTESRLITKREALTRLHRFGVDEDLSQEIARRRHGDAVLLTLAQRLRRAHTARRLVARGIRVVSRR
ncbi:hypothetical protein JOD57_002692 [Geodermatophilus bullaregiensis]|uniref:nucleotidyltransferase domain-containing protein n=1 Tax=Geodermatophilus bullaregiensis TaxID=1564160 RepID=UPI00195E81A9|nr:nucleotidyltransferase domain-containing protein [Geodermatophilus bullaregiensis]MBM7806855.1 hypothetical protein [Geodermatophilus bullaregiensis]